MISFNTFCQEQCHQPDRNDNTEMSNSSKQGIIILTRKVPVETDENSDEEIIPEGWKVPKENIPKGCKPEDENDGTTKFESKLDNLRMKWAGSNYEIVLEKIEMMESWKTGKDVDVKNALLD